MLAMQMTQINRTLCYKQSSSISLLKKKMCYHLCCFYGIWSIICNSHMLVMQMTKNNILSFVANEMLMSLCIFFYWVWGYYMFFLFLDRYICLWLMYLDGSRIIIRFVVLIVPLVMLFICYFQSLNGFWFTNWGETTIILVLLVHQFTN